MNVRKVIDTFAFSPPEVERPKRMRKQWQSGGKKVCVRDERGERREGVKFKLVLNRAKLSLVLCRPLFTIFFEIRYSILGSSSGISQGTRRKRVASDGYTTDEIASTFSKRPHRFR